MNIFRKTSAVQFVTSIRWGKYVCTYINVLLQKYLCESCISVCYYRDIPPIFSIVLSRCITLCHYSLRYIQICIAFSVAIINNRNRLFLSHNFIINILLSILFIFSLFLKLYKLESESEDVINCNLLFKFFSTCQRSFVRTREIYEKF